MCSAVSPTKHLLAGALMVSVNPSWVTEQEVSVVAVGALILLKSKRPMTRMPS